MRRWYIPTRTSSWSYNTICFCLSGWGVHMNILCTTSGFLYQKLGHHFSCFVRNDMGFPCWFFFNGLFGQGPQLLIPGGVFKRFIPTLGKTFQTTTGWVADPPASASGPQLSGRTALCSAGRSKVMGDFRTPGGSPVGWFRKQALCECDDAWLGDSISFGKLSMKSCTM